jgi:TPR repeat protein
VLVTQNWKLASEWYRKAASQGHAAAQYNLALMYFSGQGMVQDFSEAAKWYCKAADHGHANAQYNLSLMYAE